MAEPIFKTAKGAQDYILNRTREVGTQISRENNRLNQQLNKSYADFIQDNPNSLLKTEQDFEAYKANYNPGDGKDRFRAYVDVYGPQGGMERAFNYTGIAPIWFGADENETREFDPSTLKYNSETGGFQAQLRVADKKNNRSFTAPITAAGKKVAELFGFGGQEAVEENTLAEVPLEAAEEMFIKAEDFIARKLGNPGIRMLQTPTTNNVLNQYAFDISPEGRTAKEQFIRDVTGFEEGLVTEGEEPQQQEEVVGLDASTQTIDQVAIDIAKRTYGIDSKKDTALVRRPSEVKELRDALGEDFYLEPNFEFSEEDNQRLSADDKERVIERFKEQSNANIIGALAQTKGAALKNARDIRQVPGASNEEITQAATVNDFYQSDGKALSKIFAARPSLYDEFKADSNAFALKYSNPEEFNKIKASSIPQKEKNDVVKNNPLTVSASDRKELREAINTKDTKKMGGKKT